MMWIALGLMSPDAHAFCGHYAGQVGAEMYNNASQLAVVRQGSRTTLTLVNDFEGNVSEFALVVPVPEVLDAEDVAVLDGEIIGRLDAYSAPRLVTYTCDDFASRGDSGTLDSANDGEGAGDDADDSVTVEAEFSVGEYDIVVLSADESGALVTWLNDNDYAVSTDAEDLLQEYVDAGAKFFAAKVNLDETPEGSSYLSPLQFGYEADAFMLPIRLGTLNSGGEQDLIVYALSDSGQTHISNYPEVEQETDCMVDVDATGGLATFVDERFVAALSTEERPGWVLEYGWTPSGCDPCAGDPLADEDLHALGWDGETNEAYFSRLHMRYPPEAVDQDLVFYGSSISSFTQLRYIAYDADLEDRFSNCVTGWADDPGSCDGSTDTDTPNPNDDEDAPVIEEEGNWGCASAPVAPAFLLGLLALGLSRRRDGRASSVSS
ncbi:MAG: DUF2330 domain-containing protein [Proteobacteria bacterium]|nr:DUF2330 domain-containing protein [Pseudomonadota bacterium]